MAQNTRTRKAFTAYKEYHGAFTRYGIPYGPNGLTTLRDTLVVEQTVCSDVVGEWRKNNPFDLYRFIAVPTVIEGRQLSAGQVVKSVTSWPCQGYAAPDPLSKYPAPTTAEQMAYSTELLSKSNPNTPVVSIPTFVAELKDVPGMLKDWNARYKSLESVTQRWAARTALPMWFPSVKRTGHVPSGLYDTDEVLRSYLNVLETSASANLQWRWAVRPFITDVLKMNEFAVHVAKRMQWLRNLASGKPIRRKVKLSSRPEQLVTTAPLYIESIPGLVQAVRVQSFSEEVWGTARWRIPPGAPVPHELADLSTRRRKAFRMTFGLTHAEFMSTLWELIPWSWMVDWFTNFGEIISLSNNWLNLVPDNLCLMRHLLCKETMRITSIPDWLTAISPGWGRYERKIRFTGLVPAAYPVVKIPLVTGSRWSVLASLSVLNQTGGWKPRGSN